MQYLHLSFNFFMVSPFVFSFSWLALSPYLFFPSPWLLLHPLVFLICPGVQILERTSVQQVLVEKGQVMAVETDRGSIESEYFVNCAGQVNLGAELWHISREVPVPS